MEPYRNLNTPTDSAEEAGKKKRVKKAVTVDGRKVRVDLFLTPRFGMKLPARTDERNYLVVELKRPTQDITLEVMAQVQKYAGAVARDERFRSPGTRWAFWAVSNDIDDAVMDHIRDRRRPGQPSLYLELQDIQATIHVRTWSDLLADARSRLELFRDQLAFSATAATSLTFVRNVYQRFLKEDADETTGEEPSPQDARAPTEPLPPTTP